MLVAAADMYGLLVRFQKLQCFSMLEVFLKLFYKNMATNYSISSCYCHMRGLYQLPALAYCMQYPLSIRDDVWGGRLGLGPVYPNKSCPAPELSPHSRRLGFVLGQPSHNMKRILDFGILIIITSSVIFR